MKWKIIIAAGLIAGTSAQALGQQGGPPAPTPGSVDSTAVSRSTREQQEGFNRVVNEGVKVTNADGKQKAVKKKGPVAATTADFAVGATVRDKDLVQIATIERLEDDGAVVRSEDKLAKLPVDAFGKDDTGLLLGITAAEFHAAIAATAVDVPQEAEYLTVTADDMTPGAPIRDIDGVPIGTVAELVETGVIVLTDGKKVKLAMASFAKDEQGLLIGITASEFRALIGGSAQAETGG